MDENNVKKKINEEVDYIYAPKFGNSISKFIAKTGNPLKNGAIAKLLLISEKEVEELYQESIVELRKEMVDED